MTPLMNGELSDINLADLIQMICNKQSDKVVLSFEDGSSRASIYFDQGDIVHAEAGSDIGEGAVYQLLAWKSGTFQLNHYDRAPRHSVTLPWGSLLSEGARLVEGRVPPAAAKKNGKPPLPSVKELAMDQALETDMVDLFIRLEHTRSQLAERRVRKQPEQALRFMAEMVNALSAVGDKWLDIKSPAETLTGILAGLAQTYPPIEILRVDNDVISSQAITELFSTRKGDAFFHQKLTQIAKGLLAVIQMQLARLTSRFHAADRKVQWEEISVTFLDDLTGLVHDIQF
jgi:hypothetical protein